MNIFMTDPAYSMQISERLDPGLAKLFWSVFFESRGRGISLSRHFPWLDKDEEHARFVYAGDGSEVVGGLVLRSGSCTVGGRPVKYGMIGLVAVAPEKRGRGIAGELIEQAISHAKKSGIEILTLWTSKHSVYARYGFEVCDPWQYGWVRRGDSAGNIANTASWTESLEESDTLALPPFAEAVYQRKERDFSVTLVRDRAGPIVTGYDGNALAAARFMIEILPDEWRLNVLDNDPLSAALCEQGMRLKLAPANLQMWSCLKPGCSNEYFARTISFPVLDRI